MKYNVTVSVVSITCGNTEDVTGSDEIFLKVNLSAGAQTSNFNTGVLSINDGNVIVAPWGSLFSACEVEETEKIKGTIRLMDEDVGTIADPHDELGVRHLDLPVGITATSPPSELIVWTASKGGWGWSTWNYVVVLQVTRVPSIRSLDISFNPLTLTQGLATALLVTAKDPLDPARVITGNVQLTPDLTGASGWSPVGALGTPFSYTPPLTASGLLGRITNLSPPPCFTYQAPLFQIPVLPQVVKPGLDIIPDWARPWIDLTGRLADLLQDLLLRKMVVTHDPALIVKNVPTQVQVFAKDAATLGWVPGEVYINGTKVGQTSTLTSPQPFTHTFTGPTNGTVKAPGYKDSDLAFTITP